jgi:hypothetical protein
MEMLNSIYNTADIPHSYTFLENHLPSILKSKCFNKNNYPFPKEVKSTEMGHLFEHILLEYLSLSKRLQGIKGSVHNGVTKWNWNVDKKGVFHIEIDSGVNDTDNFYPALEKTMLLFSTLVRINPAPPVFVQ